MKPSLGRIVHFVNNAGPDTGKHLAAIVTDVCKDGSIDLAIFPKVTDPAKDQPVKRMASVPEDQSAGRYYSWHWPERID